MPYGNVKRYDTRGFGFLSDDQQPAASWTFFHISEIPGMAAPQEGDAFSYDIEPGSDGRPRATNLRPLTAAHEECQRVFG